MNKQLEILNNIKNSIKELEDILGVQDYQPVTISFLYPTGATQSTPYAPTFAAIPQIPIAGHYNMYTCPPLHGIPSSSIIDYLKT